MVFSFSFFVTPNFPRIPTVTGEPIFTLFDSQDVNQVIAF